jgi:gliding motility-associated-like protein
MATGKDTPPLTYSWNFTGGAAVPGGNSPGPQKVTWKNPGKYNVSLKVTKYGCSTTYTNPVTVLQSPVSSFTFKNQCIGTPSIFTDLSKGNPDSWIWNFGDSSPLSTFKNPSHLYADTGSYKVQMIAISSNGCRDTLEKNVPIYPVPTSDFITQKEICLGEYTVIEYKGNASADADYRWDFPGGTVISGAGGGPYKVTWSAVGKYNISLEVMKNGCKSDTTDSVGVKPCFVIVPDIITPNGDEENDVFFIKGVENFPTSNLVIYNRWGKKVYENEDYRNNWDGEKHPDGVYFYILTLNTGKMINGTVTIVR